MLASLAACGSGPATGPVPEAAPEDGDPALASPEVPGDATVLQARTGQGASRPADLAQDGSYAFFATCAGGDRVIVTTRAGGQAQTEVPCTGFTSRMRFVTAESVESWSIAADAGQRWSIVWTDWSQAQG